MRHIFSFFIVFCWAVSGSLVRTVDGDSFVARLSIWQNLEAIERVRVLEIDTPENKKPTVAEADKARLFTHQWLSQGTFTVESCARDSFGRVLGKVLRGKESLADKLLESGNAVKFKK